MSSAANGNRQPTLPPETLARPVERIPLRHWIAGLALHAYLVDGTGDMDPEHVAEAVVDYTDALLSELAKPEHERGRF